MSTTPTPKPAAYVVGLLFDLHLMQVLLIRKRKPAWQAGKLNGVGGKVEDGETPAQAMEREFVEEAGITVPAGWQHYMTMGGTNLDGDTFTVDFFAGMFKGTMGDIRSQEAEKLEVVRLADIHLLRSDMVENLAWAVGLARDVLQDRRPVFATVNYHAVGSADPAPPVTLTTVAEHFITRGQRDSGFASTLEGWRYSQGVFWDPAGNTRGFMEAWAAIIENDEKDS